MRVQGFFFVISDRLDDTQSFRPALPEQYPIAHGEILGSLHEPERHRRPIASPYESSIDVDNSACLADRSHMQHGLVFRLDGGRVREDQYFGDEVAVDFGRGGVDFGKNDHAFADFFPSHPFQCEGCGLAGAANGDGDAFSFDGADVGRAE